MNQVRCSAIVLSARAYGESDQVVSVLTLEHGRLRCFARAARKSRKRMGSLLEPGNRLELIMRLKDEGLSSLDRVEQVTGLLNFRERLESLALLMYAAELVELLTPEAVPLPRLFRLLTALLDWLSDHSGNMADRRFFEINLLNILGYRPLLDADGLYPLQRCLMTGSFGRVQFDSPALIRCGKLLDDEISRHVSRQPKSRAFLDNLLSI